jgi:hypothetical protein
LQYIYFAFPHRILTAFCWNKNNESRGQERRLKSLIGFFFLIYFIQDFKMSQTLLQVYIKVMNNDHDVNIQLHMCQVPRFKLNCKKKKGHLPTILLPGKRAGILILKKKFVLVENQFFFSHRISKIKIIHIASEAFCYRHYGQWHCLQRLFSPCVKSLNIVQVFFGCTFCCRLSLERSDCETIALKFIFTSLSNIL